MEIPILEEKDGKSRMEKLRKINRMEMSLSIFPPRAPTVRKNGDAMYAEFNVTEHIVRYKRAGQEYGETARRV
ncbi:hypothetical protein RvY_02524 [Ramazzottius varieornatus]|uniref:Uncharacterized protein n=1 Tax=Ramazzottius varieornatus TaxID=947166 RepID=A0A1D1UV51_RAMVA|nr:hypothetical protein RvY_02524 [Ramazzottius varieornatus]